MKKLLLLLLMSFSFLSSYSQFVEMGTISPDHGSNPCEVGRTYTYTYKHPSGGSNLAFLATCEYGEIKQSVGWDANTKSHKIQIKWTQETNKASITITPVLGIGTAKLNNIKVIKNTNVPSGPTWPIWTVPTGVVRLIGPDIMIYPFTHYYDVDIKNGYSKKKNEQWLTATSNAHIKLDNLSILAGIIGAHVTPLVQSGFVTLNASFIIVETSNGQTFTSPATPKKIEIKTLKLVAPTQVEYGQNAPCIIENLDILKRIYPDKEIDVAWSAPTMERMDYSNIGGTLYRIPRGKETHTITAKITCEGKSVELSANIKVVNMPPELELIAPDQINLGQQYTFKVKNWEQHLLFNPNLKIEWKTILKNHKIISTNHKTGEATFLATTNALEIVEVEVIDNNKRYWSAEIIAQADPLNEHFTFLSPSSINETGSVTIGTWVWFVIMNVRDDIWSAEILNESYHSGDITFLDKDGSLSDGYTIGGYIRGTLPCENAKIKVKIYYEDGSTKIVESTPFRIVDKNSRLIMSTITTLPSPSLFSVKVYTINSTKPLHQEDNIEYFDIYNTNLREGMYVIEKTMSDGTVNKEKIYKNNK